MTEERIEAAMEHMGRRRGESERRTRSSSGSHPENALRRECYVLSAPWLKYPS